MPRTRKTQDTDISQPLFEEPQPDLFRKSYEEELRAEAEARANQPVECLGMTFPNDEERRKYFLEKLREKLKDPEFRKIEGFPIGSDEDILALSDPPYYTASVRIRSWASSSGTMASPSTRRCPTAASRLPWT